jgi:site-specific DNA-methyltransferase (adenine-specific)
METITLDVGDIAPYWRNPRRITDEAVEAVMESIRQYGYQQPIVVDQEHVIIMGHTRHAALRRLGVGSIPVLVAKSLSQKQVKELRTIDNRTSELTRWDFDKLMGELDEMDQTLMASFFPEVFGPTEAENADGDAAVDSLVVDLTTQKPDPTAEFICPECFHSWEMPVSKQDVYSGHLQVKGGQA